MITTKVKSVLQANAEQLNRPLTVENVECVVDVIQEAIFTAGAEGLSGFHDKKVDWNKLQLRIL